jgi:cytochrome c biogenesis protein ResB
MKFAIFILIILMISSIIGTLIPQNQAAEYYQAAYGNMGNFIRFMKFDQVYTSRWYLLIAVFLSLSIFFCIVIKVKPLINIFKNKTFKEGANYIGLWLLHLGLILIILFFVIGNATAYQGQVYNVKNTLNQVEDTDIKIEILDFDILLTEDDHIDQYKSKVKFFDGQGDLLDQGEISVNHPMTVKGYQFSQASYGYYVDASVYKNGEKIGSAALLENEYISADDSKLTVKLDKFYPDVVEKDGDIINNSKIIKKPMLEYTIYLGTMPVRSGLAEIKDKIKVGNYEVEFDKPDYYPVIDVRNDRFETLTGLGAIIFMAGTFLVFYGPGKEKEKK